MHVRVSWLRLRGLLRGRRFLGLLCSLRRPSSSLFIQFRILLSQFELSIPALATASASTGATSACLTSKMLELSSRQLHIELPRRGLPIIEARMMVHFQTRLHPIVTLEFEESKTFRLARLFVRAVADRLRLHFGKMPSD